MLLGENEVSFEELERTGYAHFSFALGDFEILPGLTHAAQSRPPDSGRT